MRITSEVKVPDCAWFELQLAQKEAADPTNQAINHEEVRRLKTNCDHALKPIKFCLVTTKTRRQFFSNAHRSWDNVDSLSAIKSRLSHCPTKCTPPQKLGILHACRQSHCISSAVMSKHFIIVLLLFQQFRHGFAADTDARLKEHTEAMRREHWSYMWAPWSKFHVGQTVRAAISRELEKSQPAEAAVLAPMVVEYIMYPVNVHFTKEDVINPNAEMSQTDLEFRWEALELAWFFLRYERGPAMDFLRDLRYEHWKAMEKRVGDATFGSTLAVEYSQGQNINWPSVNMQMVSELLRGAKLLESLEASNESPVSSLTEADVLLSVSSLCRGSVPESSISAHELYDMYRHSKSTEHLVFCIHYLKMRAQRSQFVAAACSRFLQQHQENHRIPGRRLTDAEVEQGLSDVVRQGLSDLMDQGFRDVVQHGFSDVVQQGLGYLVEQGLSDQIQLSIIETERVVDSDIHAYTEILSMLLQNMPTNFEGYSQHVNSEVVKIKAEVAPPYYEEDETIDKIRVTIGVAPQSLEYLQDDTGLPDAVISLMALQYPRENVYLQNFPYLALAADYHLLLLWRCMRPLSLLQWYMNRCGAVPENHGFTSEQINGAVTEIASMAQYILGVFDAYEKAAGELEGQPRTSRLSAVERQRCLGLLGSNRLASTWEGSIEKYADKYIEAVDSALANIQNFYVPPADVDLSAHIQYVDGIPPGINLLISAYPVPENLPPDYLELATKLHFLVGKHWSKYSLGCTKRNPRSY
ncbi:hypothetical protein SeMB42_g05994 [Synchytrium endobioticum]|uniref:Uncharacterized protein n=1 Tax=Synchytrium endobioticum TaxID=286115 RepID=A0A507CKS1_9FUNG|nr:hypothetical protein SeMB42_g05994 [Synchytrium endobioticum]